MARRAGAFKSEKRKKELARIKKRDEKMQKRLHKKTSPQEGEAGAEEVTVEGEAMPEEEGGEHPSTEPAA